MGDELMEVTCHNGRFSITLSDGTRIMASMSLSEYGDLAGLSIFSPLQIAEIKRRVSELIANEDTSCADTPRAVFVKQMNIWARLP